MPFLDHLEELRWRIIYSLGTLFVTMIIGFLIVVKFDVVGLMQAPALPYLRGNQLVVTGFSSPFNIALQLAFFIGAMLALPVIGYQIWAFLAPALHKHERRVIMPVLFAGLILFAGGGALAYFIVVPLTLKFFTADIFMGSLTPMFTVADYFSLVTSMVLVFGLAFEVPIVLVLLSAIGLVSPEQLGAMRRWAILIIVVGSAMITPGDAFAAMFAMAVPLYLLYELSVAVAFIIQRRKRQRARREALEAERGATA
jgi:sec-independent protein translocase protein TatC